MTNFSILHFSDLHFGEKNLLKFLKDNVGTSNALFDNFFYNFKLTIESIINSNNNVKLIIITGDLGSIGEISENKYFKEFFQIFHIKEIPVIICPGNHDLHRELIQYGNSTGQFLHYNEKIMKIYDSLGFIENENYIYCLSKNFENNQSSYIFLKDENILVLSTNSCKSIELKKIGEDNNGNAIYDQYNLDKGFLLLEDLNELIKEIKVKLGLEIFQNSNKFLICHHPVLNDFNKKYTILNILESYNIIIIFSGHIHKYDFKTDERLHLKNFIAGSPLVNPILRTQDTEGGTTDLQFNQYRINSINKMITPIIYKYEEDSSKWISGTLYNDKVSFDNWQIKATRNVFELLNSLYDRESNKNDELFEQIDNNDKTNIMTISREAYYLMIDQKKFSPELWNEYIKKEMEKASYKNKFIKQFHYTELLYNRLISEILIKTKEFIERTRR